MNPLSFIPGFSWMRLAGVFALMLALAAGAWKVNRMGYKAGKDEVNAERQAERVEVAKRTIKVLDKNAADSADLQLKADKSRKALREEINRLDSDLDAAIGLLGDRPSRPDSVGGVPAGTGDRAGGLGATGAGLFKDDGIFLEGYARDTAVLQAGLKACYRDYDAVREKLNALKGPE
jgi:hypothetical protein